MSIDAYSYCPGGTSKKIKFCCPDFLTELQEIERMLEGQQHAACLRHVEGLLQKHPDRACLLGTYCMLLRLSGREDDFRTTTKTFLTKHPDNPVALAESALQAMVEKKPREAAALVHRAIAASDKEFMGRVYMAMDVAAEALVADGETVAGRALLQLQRAINPNDDQALQRLLSLNRSPAVPLLLKEDSPMRECPQDAPWKADFDEAMAPLAMGAWLTVAQRLTALAEQAEDAPAVWHNLAVLRGWLGDTAEAVEAWRKFASLEGKGEDAVEATAMAMFLEEDSLGDFGDVYTLALAVSDADSLHEKLDRADRTHATPIDPQAHAGSEGPPPRSGFLLLDRVIDELGDQVALEAIPEITAQMFLFGKETDRPARLEVFGVAADDLPATKAALAELAGDALGEVEKEEVVGRVSASRELLERNWWLPEGSTPENVERLLDEHLQKALLQRWPELPLGLLEGRSPDEAAGDSACHLRLQAAIFVLESFVEQSGQTFDFNQLRAKLGLPELGPIDPAEMPLQQLPAVRLDRVAVEKLDDNLLMAGFGRAAALQVTGAMRIFGKEIIRRPSLEDSPHRPGLFLLLSRAAENGTQALEYLEQGRKATEATGQPCGPWDLQELLQRFQLRDGEGAGQLIQHIQTAHGNDQEVMRGLMGLLMEMGVIRPDGTPTMPQQQSPQDDGGLILPDGGGESGKLWTPDGDRPAGSEGGIWTPD